MPCSALPALLISFAFACRCSRGQTEETTEESTSTVLPSARDGYVDMEIIGARALPKVGNAVELSWGRPLREYDLNWTYGVYYGLNVDEALKEPQLTTKDLYVEIHNLTFCSQYVFAVGVVNSNTRIAHPPRNTRTIGTLIDPLAPPENLQVDFIPVEHPCLLIKWSASCPNIAVPIGYSVTVTEKNPVRMTIITEPRSTSLDLAQTLGVIYGKSYDIKVSTDAIGSQPTAILSYKVPHFLQPYKVRLTSRPDGTFIISWGEPYVPYYVGPFHYEVYIYPGSDLTTTPSIFPTPRAHFVYQGNASEYTFMVGLRSRDGAFESLLTDPMSVDVEGQVTTLDID